MQRAHAIRVEFFGIPRQRARVAEVTLPMMGQTQLRDVLNQLTRQFPDPEGECIRDGKLTEPYITSLDGNRFVRDADTPLTGSQSVLILSSDAGG